MSGHDVTRRGFVATLATGVAAAWGLARPVPGLAQPAVETPSPDKVSPAVTKYTRIGPNIATAGRLEDGAIPALKALGFATIVDLRGPDEGVAAERSAAEAAGLRHLNIPVTTMIPTDAQVAEFGRIVEDAKNFPLLAHCASASRVGTMWLLYRAAHGAQIATAVAEGRAIGMHADREAAALQRLGE